MRKESRQSKIRELVAEREIATQEELSLLLQKEGYRVTQATVSRDIRELGLTKVAGAEGRQKYAILEGHLPQMEDRFIRVLRDGFVSMDQAQNILVIRTVSGMAMAVAAAVDAMRFEEVVGCIAGDDTIMVAVRSAEDTRRLMERIRKLTQLGNGEGR